jgi:hypothetical protein
VIGVVTVEPSLAGHVLSLVASEGLQSVDAATQCHQPFALLGGVTNSGRRVPTGSVAAPAARPASQFTDRPALSVEVRLLGVGRVSRMGGATWLIGRGSHRLEPRCQ